MGQMDVGRLGPAELGAFTEALLEDVWVLERMLGDGAFETGRRRIGCEQEMVLVDRGWKPFPAALEVLEALDANGFTTELGKFNIELNLEPRLFEGDCLSQIEQELASKLSEVRKRVRDMGGEVILTGILPTMRKSDLGLENLTPRQRYQALSEALAVFGGDGYELHLRGADDLVVRHDSVMMESCCTSFQVHYQVDPEDFVRCYNAAQAVTAPLLAAAVNSPLLFGRRLWMESRIPLFEQAIDARRATASLRERSSRVNFGHRWLENSAVELFREDIARFPVLLGGGIEGGSLEALRRGEVPKLRALQMHNGTIYRWNRACYGVTEGRPHLRIENRVLPAGPSVLDEAANGAFFWGLMRRMPEIHEDIPRVMDFGDARTNFIAAAQAGLRAQFRWIDGRTVAARELILEELLPIASDGLSAAGIAPRDSDRYLGVIEERVRTGRTGAAWLMESLARTRSAGLRRALAALAAGTARRQWTSGRGAHQWDLARTEEGQSMIGDDCLVEEAMSTDLTTTRVHESVALVTQLMEWKRIRHIPVEDEKGRLVGLVSMFEVLRRLNRRQLGEDGPALVESIMNPSPLTTAPETPIAEAVALMMKHRADCLLVVKDEQLVGIVTEHDVLALAADLLGGGRPGKEQQ